MKRIITIAAILTLTLSTMGMGNGTCDGSGSGSNGGNGGARMGSGDTGSNGGSGGMNNAYFYGNGMGSGFDVESIVTLTGEVIGFQDGSGTGENLYRPVLLVDGVEYVFSTGPAWFMEQQDIGFEMGQLITVTGAVTTNDQGQNVIIVAQLTLGDELFVLRDELGHPVWAASRGSNSGMQNRNTYLDIAYDIASEIQVDGTITTLTVGSCTPGTYPGYQLTLDTGDTTYNVHLAPYWYLMDQNVPLNTGDLITVTGMPAQVETGDGTLIDILVARIIEWSDESGTYQLVLRDEDGLPLWQPLRGGRWSN